MRGLQPRPRATLSGVAKAKTKPRNTARARGQTRSPSRGLDLEPFGLLLLALGLAVAVLLAPPLPTGTLGQAVQDATVARAGWLAFLIPVLPLYAGASLLLRRNPFRGLPTVLGLMLITTGVWMVHTAFQPPAGGTLGVAVVPQGSAAMPALITILGVLTAGLGVEVVFRLPPGRILRTVLLAVYTASATAFSAARSARRTLKDRAAFGADVAAARRQVAALKKDLTALAGLYPGSQELGRWQDAAQTRLKSLRNASEEDLSETARDLKQWQDALADFVAARATELVGHVRAEEVRDFHTWCDARKADLDAPQPPGGHARAALERVRQALRLDVASLEGEYRTLTRERDQAEAALKQPTATTLVDASHRHAARREAYDEIARRAEAIERDLAALDAWMTLQDEVDALSRAHGDVPAAAQLDEALGEAFDTDGRQVLHQSGVWQGRLRDALDAVRRRRVAAGATGEAGAAASSAELEAGETGAFDAASAAASVPSGEATQGASGHGDVIGAGFGEDPVGGFTPPVEGTPSSDASSSDAPSSVSPSSAAPAQQAAHDHAAGGDAQRDPADDTPPWDTGDTGEAGSAAHQTSGHDAAGHDATGHHAAQGLNVSEGTSDTAAHNAAAHAAAGGPVEPPVTPTSTQGGGEVGGIPIQLPPIDLLDPAPSEAVPPEARQQEVEKRVARIDQTLADFNLAGRVVSSVRGPTVTRFEVEPAPGEKISRYANLSDDLALAMAASSVRIEAPIPGKSVIGLEVPNADRDLIRFRSAVVSSDFQRTRARLPLVLGTSIEGDMTVGDLAKMPHLLIAGSTGSGKSVAVNTLISSLIYKFLPTDLRFLMIDPKMVELTPYDGVPHLLRPVVTNAADAAGVLLGAVAHMERRYKMMSRIGAKNLDQYNEKAANLDLPHLPFVAIVIDELADLMITSPKEVESAIMRLAQMARATGMHLILATQRPSVDILTSLIKVNVPARMAFAVSSGHDSRTILDTMGAERLVGNGDMLYYQPGMAKPARLQGPFVSETEIVQVASYLRRQYFDDEFVEAFGSDFEPVNADESEASGLIDWNDDKLRIAAELVINEGQASVSRLQRRLQVGHARAGKLMDSLEGLGVVGPHTGSKPREVLVEFDELPNLFGK